jgi:hypothetical protein
MPWQVDSTGIPPSKDQMPAIALIPEFYFAVDFSRKGGSEFVTNEDGCSGRRDHPLS